MMLILMKLYNIILYYLCGRQINNLTITKHTKRSPIPQNDIKSLCRKISTRYPNKKIHQRHQQPFQQ